MWTISHSDVYKLGVGLLCQHTKCVFYLSRGALLGHIVNCDGIAMDPNKVHAILTTPTPTRAKALNRFLRQSRWHSRMLHYLAEFMTSLHAVLYQVPFQWTETEESTYKALKLMLSQVPVVQPPNWSQPFHIFVDVSDVAIGSTLMQMMPPYWYWPVYYARRRLSAAKKNYPTYSQQTPPSLLWEEICQSSILSTDSESVHW